METLTPDQARQNWEEYGNLRSRPTVGSLAVEHTPHIGGESAADEDIVTGCGD